VVSPNADLLTALSEHPFFESPPFEGIGKVDEADYVTYLTEVQERIDDVLRLQIPAIVKRAEQLQTRLAADDFDGVAHIWIDSQLLWTYAEGGYIRREFALPAESTNAELKSGPDVNDVEASPNGRAQDGIPESGVGPGGTYFVFLPGFIQAVIFPGKDRLGRAGERSTELQRRMSQAFVSGDKTDLVRVVNFLAGVDRYAPEIQALSKQVFDELARLTRLSVTALIANTGGTPMSLSQQTCEVELMLGGYAYTASEDGTGKPRERRDSVSLEMHLLDDAGHPIEPIVIEAGGVRPIRAVYRTPLSDERLPEGGTLYDLLNAALAGAERDWRLTLRAVLQRNPAAAIQSRKLSFRDTHSMQVDVTVPQRVSSQPRDQDRRLLAAREAELSEARAELSSTKAALLAAEGDAAQLYAALRAERDAAPSPAEGSPSPSQTNTVQSDGSI
jgi:hypothetical protein